MFELRPHTVRYLIVGESTEDEAGTVIPGEATESADIPAHVDTLSGRRLEIAQRVNNETTAVIYMDWQELPAIDRIKHVETDVLYSLTGPPVNQGGMSESLALHVKEVR
ncbi:hypothetical protein JY98_03780 [Exiguobacterium mexicanum]|nr:hypothetical protein JY98_03780 [Exiguobacterium mexicanum]